MKNIKYPLILENNAQLKTISDVYDIYDQQIKLFFLTPLKSRLGRPSLGTNIYRYLGDNITDNLAERIRETVISEIRTFFPQLKLISVSYISENKSVIINYNLSVEKNPEQPRKLILTLL